MCLNESCNKTRIRKHLSEDKAWLKWNGTHQQLVYAYEVNILGDNIETTKWNPGPLNDFSKDVGPEVNADITKYMLLPRH
jgi:hypothetical protein